MKSIAGGLIALLTLGSMTATTLEAQRRGPTREGRPPAGVEALIRSADRIGLEEAQLAELEAIRQEGVQRRVEHVTELTELRSRLAAGLVERSEVMAVVERHRDETRTAVEDHRARVDALLTDTQRAAVVELGLERGPRDGRMARRGGRAGVDGRRGPRGGDVGPPRRPGRRGCCGR